MDVNNPKYIEEVNISGGNSPKHDTDLYYVYRNSPDELYLYFLNMGVYSLNLKTRSITKVIAPMSGEEQIRAMARDAENRLCSCIGNHRRCHASTYVYQKLWPLL